MLQTLIDGHSISIGERFSVSFQRTLRLPEDGRTYPLPPGLGAFPVHRVEDYADRVPAEWRERGGAFIPMYQREALWLGFSAAAWKPNAVKVSVGRVNAVSGQPDRADLRAEPQDYVVCPDQPWLDGINTGDGTVRQFVAMPLGLGYTVEAAVTGREEFGGIQLTVFEPRPGRFPDEPPPGHDMPLMMFAASPQAASPQAMGLGAGGTMRQKIYPDPHGLDAWDLGNYGSVFVHIINSTQFKEVTGREAPPTPIDAATYTQYGFPWFALYDESRGDVAPSPRLTGAKTIGEHDRERGEEGAGPDSFEVSGEQIKTLDPDRSD